MGTGRPRAALGGDLVHVAHLIDAVMRSKETEGLSSVIRHVSCRERIGIQFS